MSPPYGCILCTLLWRLAVDPPIYRHVVPSIETVILMTLVHSEQCRKGTRILSRSDVLLVQSPYSEMLLSNQSRGDNYNALSQYTALLTRTFAAKVFHGPTTDFENINLVGAIVRSCLTSLDGPENIETTTLSKLCQNDSSALCTSLPCSTVTCLKF